MPQGTLWASIEQDRRRWIRAGAIVVALLALLVLAVWIVAASRSTRAMELVFRVLAPLAAVLMFPLVRAARELKTKQAIGAVPLATGGAPDTTRALHDVMLAVGLTKTPDLLMYLSDAHNAFATRAGGTLSISVSSAFTTLPRAEQRAAFAMLVGRSRVDTTSFAAEHQVSESFREDPVPPDRDPVLFAAWLDVAVAGDREGLRILQEPAPMIELLERLSVVSTVVPGFAYATEHDAVFGFLAWPYVDSAKMMAEVASETGRGLPPEAAAAVAALIAEEQVMRGPFGLPRSKSSAYISGAEALRALRLREMAGAEGAVAGSTTTAARRLAKERREGGPADGGTPVSDPAASTAPEAIAASPAVDYAASAAPAAVIADAVASGPAMPMRISGERITVRCPECGAGNAPINSRCISCGERLPSIG